METDIEHTTEGDHDFVTPRGDLDIATHSKLRMQIDGLVERGRVNIVVDLSRTTFLDSTALGALIEGRHRAQAAGGSLVLICDRPQLLRLFEITKLDLVFDIFQSQDAWRSAGAS